MLACFFVSRMCEAHIKATTFGLTLGGVNGSKQANAG